MTETQLAPISPIAVAADLTFADLRAALAAGWRDFLAHPVYGMFFGAIYVIGGLALTWALTARGSSGWLLSVVAGFPLLAPFTAVGLYEVSRRREAGLPLSWGTVFGALRGRGDEQLLMMGGFIFVGFTFWIALAHGIFAIFLAESGVVSQSLEIFRTPAGMAALAVGGVVGAIVAFVFYAVTVISLPMLVDRDVDFLTAIIKSLRAVQANRQVMLAWAVLIALALFVAMLPAFLGLLVVLPVLGHATWHLYRRAVR
ncbi:MAG: DUF2189 domain-containing protein [Proteobacteria bacterium]|nr:DUF2189 domain-containing protein [Pseudomonadota bacterium]